MKLKNKLVKFRIGIGVAVMMLAMCSVRLWADDGSVALPPAGGDGVNGVSSADLTKGSSVLSGGNQYGVQPDGSLVQTPDLATNGGTSTSGSVGGGGPCEADITVTLKKPTPGPISAGGGTQVDVLFGFPSDGYTSASFSLVRYVTSAGTMVNSTDVTSSFAEVITNGGHCTPGGASPAPGTTLCLEANPIAAGLAQSATGAFGFQIIYTDKVSGIGCMFGTGMTYGADVAAPVGP